MGEPAHTQRECSDAEAPTPVLQMGEWGLEKAGPWASREHAKSWG